MTGKALICKLGKLEKIEGADRIAQVKMFGETVIVSKDYKEGTVGLLFDCETQLSHEFCSANNLYRHSELNADKTKSGYMEDNRRVRPIRLKGVQCSAMFMPINSIPNGNFDEPEKHLGVEIESFAGVPICSKYIPPKTKSTTKQGLEGRYKNKASYVPTFKEHMDTDQWGRNTHKVQEGDLVIITEKLHGTSGRCGYLPVFQHFTVWQSIVAWFKLWIFKTFPDNKPYKFVVGSRRVVKSINGNEAENKAHYYNEDLWTTIAKREFEGKLRKGETVYFEIVGYTPSGEPIMGSHNNTKLQKFMSKSEYKEFINKYGSTTRFHYGTFEMTHNGDQTTTDKTNKVFIYRITMTNDDGESIDLSWKQVKTRSEQLGVTHVPEIYKTICFNEEYKGQINQLVKHFTESDSKNFPQHINEGVCVRIENGSLTPQIYKSKRFIFKCLEGIIKDNPDNIDVEETN